MAERRGKRSESLDASSNPAAAGASGPLSAIPELMRRAIAMGLSGFFFTEEAIRKALGDAMPRIRLRDDDEGRGPRFRVEVEREEEEE